MREIVTIDFDFASPSGNTLRSWDKRGWGAYAKYRDNLCWLLRILDSKGKAWEPTLPGKRRKSGLLTSTGRPRVVKITRTSSGTLDNDRFVHGCTVLMDALVLAGYLWDDSPRWVNVEYEQAKGPRGIANTKIEIFEEE